MVSDSVLSLSVSVSLLMCARAKERCYYRPLVVVIITAESMAKQCLSQFLRVSLSGPGVIMIDCIASSSTACLALCPCAVQHTLYSGRGALTLKGTCYLNKIHLLMQVLHVLSSIIVTLLYMMD